MANPSIRFTAHREHRKFNKGSEIRREIDQTLSGPVKQELVKRFGLVVADWTNKPRFFGRRNNRLDSISMLVHPGGNARAVEIYGFVTLRTRPHRIEGNPTLFFPGGPYEAKTQPGGGYGGPGIAPGPTVAARSVQHPGTEPRNFEAKIAKEYESEFERVMEAAFRRALR
jgi:hypothetical protein